MRQPFAHSMMPQASHDELARQIFATALRMHIEDEVMPGDALLYEKKVKPAMARARGAAEPNYKDIRRQMEREPYYQMWSSLVKTGKEMLWDSVGESVERQLPDLIARSRPKAPLGSLTLDPAMPIPRYHAAVDIHWMPGAYHREITKDDVYAGALYDRGSYYVVAAIMGKAGNNLPDKTHTARGAFHYLDQHHPNFRPKRILDIGCAIGSSTVPYADKFPEAEIHGIDVGAPLLRYGHARAEAMGKRIHFSQQNGERTNFPDGHFDLVVTHAVAHETSSKAIRNLLKETYRLLAPGGLSYHTERKFFQGLSDYEAYLNDWDTFYENEPFKGTLRESDPRDLLAEAGFDPKRIFFYGTNRAGGFFAPGHPQAFGSIFGASKS